MKYNEEQDEDEFGYRIRMNKLTKESRIHTNWAIAVFIIAVSIATYLILEI